MKKCELCNSASIKGERFCKTCKKAVMNEMKESGYIGYVAPHGDRRSADHKENRRETKYGAWS